MALKAEMFLPRPEFTARVDELFRWVKSHQKIEGAAEIVYPGERGQRRTAKLTRSGLVPPNDMAWRTLAELCQPPV
jgi:LDH2 family malate/lactate/ureidoglycolate dehydrogenase